MFQMADLTACYADEDDGLTSQPGEGACEELGQKWLEAYQRCPVGMWDVWGFMLAAEGCIRTKPFLAGR